MPQVRMPDGVVVAFPDNMPQEQIKGLIASKFPHVATQPPMPGAARTAFDQGMQGATFGFADEASDAIGAAGAMAYDKVNTLLNPDQESLFAGKSYSDVLKQARENSQAQLSNEMEQRPGLSITSNLAGGLLTGGAGASTKAGGVIANSLRSGGTAARIVKGAAAGAVSGGAYGAGTAEDGKRLQGAEQGAIGGAIIGGAIPGATSAVSGTLKGTKNLITGIGARSGEELQGVSKELKKSAGGIYDQMRQAGAVLNDTTANNIVSSIKANVAKQKFIPGLNPKTTAIIDDLEAAVKNGNLGLDDLDQYRRLLGRVGGSEDGVSAGTARKAIDDAVKALDDSNLQSGSKQAVDLLHKGRAQYAQASKFEAISDILAKADGDPNKIKSGLNRFLNNEDNLAGWTKDEVSALKEAAKNGSGEWLLKGLGRFGVSANNIFLPSVGGGLAYSISGGPGALLLTGAGTVARQGQKYIARGKAENLLSALEKGAAKGTSVTKKAISPSLSLPAGGAIGMEEGASTRSAIPATPPASPAPATLPQPAPTKPTQKSENTPEDSLNNASQMAGIDSNLLHGIASVESGLEPNAKNPTSTASGLMQITYPTWKSLVRRYGKETGVKMTDIMNPNANAIMGAFNTRDNIQKLTSKLGREPNPAEVYTAHFLGANGAIKLFNAPDRNDAADLFPEQARNNRAIFYDGNRARSVYEVKKVLGSKIDNVLAQRRKDALLQAMLDKIPQDAVAELRSNPSLADNFNNVYGDGAAAHFLA